MRFKGTIIITDPCYIIKDNEKGRPSMKDFPGLAGVTGNTKFSDFTNEQTQAYKKLEVAQAEWDRRHPDDWSRCRCGKKMEVLGIKTYLTRETEYGDWSCTTFDSDTKEPLGNFCADAGLVSVFLLDEVLAYNPEFNYHSDKLWTTTMIPNFDGDVEITTVSIPVLDDDSEDPIAGKEVRVIGTGNINFYTTQTGF